MKDALTWKASEVLQKKFDTSLDAVWEYASDPEHGDYTTTVAMKVGKSIGCPPRNVANVLAEELTTLPGILKVEVAGAGYVNVWLQPQELFAELQCTVIACVPQAPRPSDAPVIIEYSSPNIAKPLGIHHILSTIIGQTLVNIYRHAGYRVIAWNYIADWGVQFGKLFVAFRRWGAKPIEEHSLDELLALYVRFHKEVDAVGQELEEEARREFKKLEDGDAALREFLNAVVATTKISLKHLYERLHVAFDVDYGEGFYEDKMVPVIAEGKQKKVFTEGEKGALVAHFPDDAALPPYMIVKSDGATLYSTRDLAQMRYRIDAYHPQAIYIVTDIAQKLHFEQLIATCKQLQWDLPAFENILFGRMRFTGSKMSTRTGNIVKLEEVLDEGVHRAGRIIAERGESIQTENPSELAEMMGVGALVYGILSQNRKMDIVFDWDNMLSFEATVRPTCSTRMHAPVRYCGKRV